MAARYGLVLSLTEETQFDEARRHMSVLRDAYPLNIPFRIAEAAIFEKAQQPEEAVALLEKALDLSPSNYPLSIAYAETLLTARKARSALEVLAPLSVERPNDEYLWYLMAEAYGLANDIPGVHEAHKEDIGDLKIKISGCINACGHHHVGHIGILGVDKKGEEFYQLTLGGSADENASIGDIVGRGLSTDEVVDAVERVVTRYLELRTSAEERFIDAYRRLGAETFKEALYANAA